MSDTRLYEVRLDPARKSYQRLTTALGALFFAAGCAPHGLPAELEGKGKYLPFELIEQVNAYLDSHDVPAQRTLSFFERLNDGPVEDWKKLPRQTQAVPDVWARVLGFVEQSTPCPAKHLELTTVEASRLSAEGFHVPGLPEKPDGSKWQRRDVAAETLPGYGSNRADESTEEPQEAN